nr:unnamed protein product [Callosobruchus chinensis]
MAEQINWSCEQDEVLIDFVRTHEVLYNLKITSDWDHDKIVKLVGMYETKPGLWDPTNTYYHMKNEKHDAWTEIAKELECAVNVVKGKMASLLSSLSSTRAWQTSVTMFDMHCLEILKVYIMLVYESPVAKNRKLQKCGEAVETAKHVIFDCPALCRRRSSYLEVVQEEGRQSLAQQSRYNSNSISFTSIDVLLCIVAKIRLLYVILRFVYKQKRNALGSSLKLLLPLVKAFLRETEEDLTILLHFCGVGDDSGVLFPSGDYDKKELRQVA